MGKVMKGQAGFHRAIVAHTRVGLVHARAQRVVPQEPPSPPQRFSPASTEDLTPVVSR